MLTPSMRGIFVETLFWQKSSTQFCSFLLKNSDHFCQNHFAKPVSAKNSAVISFAEPKTWFLSCLANIDIDCLAPFLKNIPHVMNV